MATDPLTVLHIAPHPDDELIGAPATLMALRDAGHRILSFFSTFGRPDEEERRRAEAVEASTRARFEFVPPKVPAAISSADDRAAAFPGVVAEVARLLACERPAIVVSPSPHDNHPAHELVARAVCEALEAAAGAGQAPRWWMWGLWGDLPLPTLATAFDGKRLDEVVEALEAYAGELRRNDYRRVVRGRGEMNASLGPERVFGFGTTAPAHEYVEILTEAVAVEGRWRLGSPRWLVAAQPLAGSPTEIDVGGWLHAPSVADVLGLGWQDRPRPQRSAP